MKASQTSSPLNALEEEHTKYIWGTAKRKSGGRERVVGDKIRKESYFYTWECNREPPEGSEKWSSII